VLRVRAQRGAAREKPVFDLRGAAPDRVRSADGRRFATVSQALQAAADGDRLTLDPGVYEEDLVLDRPVTIAAAEGPDEVCLRSSTPIRISADTRFEGLVLSAAATASPGAAVLRIDGGTVQVSNCAIAGRVEVLAETVLTMASCRIVAAAQAGLYAAGSSAVQLRACVFADVDGTGVVAAQSASVRLTNCRVERAAGSGLRVLGSARMEADASAILQVGGSGVLVEGTASVALNDCWIEGSRTEGLRALGSSAFTGPSPESARPGSASGGVVLTGCQLIGSGEDGVLVQGSAQLRVSATRVRRSGRAGAAVTDHGVLELDDCDVDESTTTGLICRGGGRLSAADTRVSRSTGNGLFVTGKAVAELRTGSIERSGYSAVHAGGAADLTLTDCRLENTSEHGVHVAGEGRVRLVDMRIRSAELSGMHAEGSARVEVSGTRVDSCGAGLTTSGTARLTVRDSIVTRSARAGVEVGAQTELQLHGSRVEECGTAGVVLVRGSQAELEDCEIRNCAGSGVVIWTDTDPRIVRTRIERMGKNGVYAGDGATATVESCSVAVTSFPALHVGVGSTIAFTDCEISAVEADLSLAEGARPRFERCRVRDVTTSTIPGVVAVAGAAGASTGRPVRSTGAEVDALGPVEDLDDLLAELNSLAGLSRVKQDVASQATLMQMVRRRQEAGLAPPPLSRHLVFAGNPGTGKTTIARLYGRLLRSLGMLEVGHLVEADRSAMIGSYVGHTAPKTEAVFRRAMGGVLFIDEAYSLAPQGQESDFGQEAISTLVKLMEDHRDDVVVIVAGYFNEMEHFVASNPGLSSRFSRTLHFDDYSSAELTQIVAAQAAQHQYDLPDETRAALLNHFDALPRLSGFGNGRTARQLFQRMTEQQARRVASISAPSTDDLTRIVVADLPTVGENPVTAEDVGHA
jgi:hypothetical protein